MDGLAGQAKNPWAGSFANRSDMRTIRTSLGVALLLCAADQAFAQNATVTLSSQKQYIRGFGGMVHIPWAGDLTAAERTLAFGTADGQLGFTILRIAVPDGNTSVSSYVTTAKAAIAAGGIVFASPWNSSGNMDSSQFASYADHLSSFVSYMKGQGAELYAISVQNEPDYGAQSGWRVWTAAQCHDFILAYGDKIGTKLMSCESFNYTKSLYDPTLNDPAALDKLGVLGTHLYGTSVNNFPYPLFDQKAAGKIERWMTEHYTDSNTDANSWPNALGVATELHHAMVDAQFNGYTWWYIKRSYGPINNGAITKRGWCMAHWSRFIRPGFYRVDATATPASGVYLSAYKNDTDVVIIAVNTGSATSINVSVAGANVSSYDRFTTSSGKSFASDGKVAVSGGSIALSLEASSVTTLHGSGSGSPLSGAGGASGSGGSSGATPGLDAGRDGRGPGDTAGIVGSGGNPGAGTGGAAGPDGAVNPIGSGGTPGSGGALGEGGAQGAGGAPVGAGGATGTGTVLDNGNKGCSCCVGRPSGRSSALALLVAPLLGCLLRRRRRS
jgi:glucuronoarabinoxylan endo-1,4-beta-xylanase